MNKGIIYCIGLGALILLLFVLNLLLGSVSIPASDVLRILMGDTSDEVLGAEAAKELCEKFKGRDGFESCIYSGFGHAAYDTAPDFPRRMYDFIKENNT